MPKYDTWSHLLHEFESEFCKSYSDWHPLIKLEQASKLLKTVKLKKSDLLTSFHKENTVSKKSLLARVLNLSHIIVILNKN